MMYNLSESHLSSHSTTAVRNKCLCSFVTEEEYRPSLTTTNANTAIVDPTLRCPACVQRALKPHRDRHEQALIDHSKAKEECAKQLQKLPNHHHLSELQAESQRLRDRLATLRNECAAMAVRVASQAVENDSHREASNMDPNIEVSRIQLACLEHSLLEGSMHHALQVASNQVRVLRFQWARKALAMHRLDIDPEDIKLTTLQKRRQTTQPAQQLPRRARGIGKIGGLPLPHAGPELYGVLPPRELQSALRLVASVTSTVARCLGIVLPHPILLTPNGPCGDVTETVSEFDLQRRLRENHHPSHRNDNHNNSHNNYNEQQPTAPPEYNYQPVGSSSTSSLYSLMDASYWKRSAKKALAKATGQRTTSNISTTSNATTYSTSSSSASSSFANKTNRASTTNFVPPSMETSHVTLRMHHATAAVLAEDQSATSSKFALAAEVMNQEAFAIALQLLQNNVIVLCIRAGVPVSKLWPAEAMLLNLYALDQYCGEQTAVSF